MIFFDLDDTLLDFMSSDYLGLKATYHEYYFNDIVNFHYFYEIWCKIRKKYFRDYILCKLSFNKMQLESIFEFLKFFKGTVTIKNANYFLNTYLKNFEENWKMFSDVEPCLKQLKEEYRLGIISNGNSIQQISKLKKLNIIDFFEIVVISEDIGTAKPDLKIFEFACEKSNMKPSECYYIGDNLFTDVLSSQQIMMKSIWLNRKGKDNRESVKMVTSLNEILNLLKIYEY